MLPLLPVKVKPSLNQWLNSDILRVLAFCGHEKLRTSSFIACLKVKIRNENLIIAEAIPDYFGENRCAIVEQLSKIASNNSNLQSEDALLSMLLVKHINC